MANGAIIMIIIEGDADLLRLAGKLSLGAIGINLGKARKGMQRKADPALL